VILCLLSLNVMSQSDSTQIMDTTISDVDQFIKRVARIEFVKIDPICTIQRRHIDNRRWKKKVNVCHAESVLECVLIDEEPSCEVNYSRLLDNKIISPNDVDSVLQILLKTESVNYLAVCYSPRHGILLYDTSDVKIGYVEICFECDRSMVTLEIPDIGFLPDIAFEKLRTLFDKYGF